MSACFMLSMKPRLLQQVTKAKVMESWSSVQHRIDEEDVLKCSRPSLFTHYQRLPPTRPIQVNTLCTENVACLSVYPITSRLYHRPQYLPSSTKCGPLNWRDMPGHPVMFCAGLACSNPVVLHIICLILSGMRTPKDWCDFHHVPLNPT